MKLLIEPLAAVRANIRSIATQNECLPARKISGQVHMVMPQFPAREVVINLDENGISEVGKCARPPEGKKA